MQRILQLPNKVIEKEDFMFEFISYIISNIEWIAFASALIAFITLKKSHKRSRREMTVNLLLDWSKNLDKDASLARKYAQQLSDEQARDLYNQKRVKFNSTDYRERRLYINIKKLLKGMSSNTESKGVHQKGKTLYLTELECREFRWLVISYLNKLESVLVAWMHNCADSKIIEEQFGYLFDESKGESILENVRKAAGRENTYPAIEKFQLTLKAQREKKLRRSRKL